MIKYCVFQITIWIKISPVTCFNEREVAYYVKSFTQDIVEWGNFWGKKGKKEKKKKRRGWQNLVSNLHFKKKKKLIVMK